MSPDDRNAGSTSKAQLSCCTGEVSKGQTADSVFYGSLQSNCLVFFAFVSLPCLQRSGGRESEDGAQCGTSCRSCLICTSPAWLREMWPSWLRGAPHRSPLSPLAGDPRGYHLGTSYGSAPRRRRRMASGMAGRRWAARSHPARWGRWIPVPKKLGGKALGVQQPLKSCR